MYLVSFDDGLFYETFMFMFQSCSQELTDASALVKEGIHVLSELISHRQSASQSSPLSAVIEVKVETVSQESFGKYLYSLNT